MTTPTPYVASPGATICLGRHVPDDYEWRSYIGTSHWVLQPAISPDGDRLVECRPIRLPDPHGTRFTIDDDEGHLAWLTWVREMRDRTDLDQWQVASASGDWNPASSCAWDGVADSHPIIVRRTQP
jgi:hypothetical protein